MASEDGGGSRGSIGIRSRGSQWLFDVRHGMSASALRRETPLTGAHAHRDATRVQQQMIQTQAGIKRQRGRWDETQ